MSLKTKLISSISAFMFILGLLIMGVFASPSATINLGGSLSFQAKNVYAIVDGTIVGAVESEALEGKVLNLDTLTFNYETDVITEGAKWSNINLRFDDLGSTITIAITIENKATDRPLYVKVEDEIGDVDNLTKSIIVNGSTYTGGMLTLPESTGDGTSVETIVLTMEIDDPNVSLADKLTYGYEISLQDESFATDPDNVGDITVQEKLAYALDDTTMTASVKMIDTTTTTGDIEVPMFVKDGDKVYTVSSVAEKGFENATITSLILPDTIEVLSDYAFSECTNLAYVNMPKKLKSIGYGAFNSTKISEIILPEGVTTIDEWAFRNCTNLKKVVLSENTLYIGGNFINGCSNLKFTISNNIKYLGTETNAYFLAGGVVDATAVSYTLNENCKVLTDEAFDNNTVVQEVVLPDEMKSISSYAFNECTNLTTINLPSTLVYMGSVVFQNCANLSSEIVIPLGVTEIKKNTFYNCSKISSVTLHDNITSIGKSAFEGCHKLLDVTLPANLEYIGDYAFDHCYGATNTSLTIPSTIKQIGGRTYDPENPNLDVIGTHVFYDMATNTLTEFVMEENENFIVVDGVLYRKDAEGNPSVMIAYPPMKEGASFEMPDTVVDAFELSLSRPFHLREIVLSDSFVIRNNQDQNLNNKNWGNNLAIMIYIYSGVTTITCKDTNPNYMSYNGAVYSKDGTTLYYTPMLSGLNVNDETEATLTIKKGTTTIFYGALGCDSNYVGNYAPENNQDEANHLKRFDKLYIPASVNDIDVTTLTMINNQSWTIEVAEDNATYQVNATSGKLEAKSE